MSWKDNRTGFLKIEEGKQYTVRILLPFQCNKCKATHFYPNFPNVTCSNCGAPVNDLQEAECVSGWYHRIPSVTKIEGNQRETVRKYRTFLCSMYGAGKSAGCMAGLCGRKDPMFDMLSDRDKKKTDRITKIETDVHFQVTPQHIVPVYNYNDKSVQILKFGNDLRKEFARIIEVRRVLAGRDIKVWKAKEGDAPIKYHAEALDPSAFTVEVDYDMINMDTILSFEKVDKERVWEFVTTGKTPAEQNAMVSSGATPVAALSPVQNDGDFARYSTARKHKIDVGTKFVGKELGELIDGKQFGYLAWLVNQSKDPVLSADAAWLDGLHKSGALMAMIVKSSAPEPMPEPEPEPEPEPARVTYVSPSVATAASSTQSALLTTANALIEAKFKGRPDEDVIKLLTDVYGPYKSVAELSITGWQDDKLGKLIQALATVA
jgi:hypothetical protein